MCKFHSLILTKGEVFDLPDTDSHEAILEHFHLKESRGAEPNILRVELLPPRDGDWADLSSWSYVVDQDITPPWHVPELDEQRAREALARRAKDWPWLPLIAKERAAAFAAATCTDPADRPRAEAAARELLALAGHKDMAVVWVNTPQEGASLGASLRASLGESLWASLGDSLWASLWDAGWVTYYRVGPAMGVKYKMRDARTLYLYHEILQSCFAVWATPSKIILCERPKAVNVKAGKLVGLTFRS
jgi:hypothetical protein